ncbi:MAG: hypothetical protein ACYDHN_13900 [Solirubrobacteraceae bacterium]
MAFDQCLYVKECRIEGSTSDALSIANRVQVPAADLGDLYVDVLCGHSSPKAECGDHFGDPNHYAAVVYLYAADLTLEQQAGPSAGNAGGELASAPTVGGTSDLTFAASDPGAGVYEAQFSVDGQVVQSSVVDENGGRCKNVGETSDGRPAFLYLQPCLASVSADVGLDTTRIANGVHHLVVSVLDAAGNAAPVLDRQITIYNKPPPGTPGPPNGVNASTQASLVVRWKHSAKAAITSSYGSSHAIVGRLTAAAGVPIVGAQIEVLAKQSLTGTRAVALASPRTDSRGDFTLRLARGLSSRSLRFVYRAHLGDPVAAASRTLRLNVRAPILLAIAPRITSVGRSIAFHGRLRGGPVPAEGKQLILEARAPGSSWIEFQVVRTDARGRFHAGYRFKFPGPAVYQFRARSEPESDYPFAAGASRAVAVRER